MLCFALSATLDCDTLLIFMDVTSSSVSVLTLAHKFHLTV